MAATHRNPNLPAPTAPHEWVDEVRCLVCGEAYATFRPGVSFAEGAQLVRLAAGDRHECGGGGYRSRRPVLWAMRVLKLREWYLRHATCAPDAVERDGKLVDPLTGREWF